MAHIKNTNKIYKCVFYFWRALFFVTIIFPIAEWISQMKLLHFSPIQTDLIKFRLTRRYTAIRHMLGFNKKSFEHDGTATTTTSPTTTASAYTKQTLAKNAHQLNQWIWWHIVVTNVQPHRPYQHGSGNIQNDNFIGWICDNSKWHKQFQTYWNRLLRSIQRKGYHWIPSVSVFVCWNHVRKSGLPRGGTS